MLVMTSVHQVRNNFALFHTNWTQPYESLLSIVSWYFVKNRDNKSLNTCLLNILTFSVLFESLNQDITDVDFLQSCLHTILKWSGLSKTFSFYPYYMYSSRLVCKMKYIRWCMHNIKYNDNAIYHNELIKGSIF